MYVHVIKLQEVSQKSAAAHQKHMKAGVWHTSPGNAEGT
jgi:hypothetical protein